MNVGKVIGIAGGIGPMAGVRLHQLVIQETDNGGTDQGHRPVIHISFSSIIPDRTKYLLGETKDDPAKAMILVMRAIQASAESIGAEKVVAGIPCNTFHAPGIWDRFIRLLKEKNLDVQVVHMLDETARYISQNYPRIKNIGLMSTTGTRKVNVYGQILKPLGYNLLEVSEEIQPELHDSIYNTKWGIKAVSPVTGKARKNFESYTRTLIKQGAEVIILGCTEIPLALPETEFEKIPLIDPMLALARALIKNTS